MPDILPVVHVIVGFCFNDDWNITGEHFTTLDSQNVLPSENKPTTIELHSPDVAADLTVVSSKPASDKGPSSHGDNIDDIDEDRVKDILANSEMREILLDNKIQQLMETLRTDPNKANM